MRQPLKFFRADLQDPHFIELLGELPAQPLHHHLLIDRVGIEDQDQSNQAAHGSVQAGLKERIIHLDQIRESSWRKRRT